MKPPTRLYDDPGEPVTLHSVLVRRVLCHFVARVLSGRRVELPDGDFILTLSVRDGVGYFRSNNRGFNSGEDLERRERCAVEQSGMDRRAVGQGHRVHENT